MYRPTVRYNDIFRDYIEEVSDKTSLDKNQILRLALFAAAHSEFFNNTIQNYKVDDRDLSPVSWSLEDQNYWLKQQLPERRGIAISQKSKEKPQNKSSSSGGVEEVRRKINLVNGGIIIKLN